MTGYEMIVTAGAIAEMLLDTKWESEGLRNAAIEIKILGHTACAKDGLGDIIERMDAIDEVIDDLRINGLLPTIDCGF